MRVGINFPWKNYGWDFGLPPQKDNGHPWGPRAEWRATIDQALSGFSALGLFAVRWFILGDGVVYGTGADRPRQEGGLLGPWHFDPPAALPGEVLADFAFLLQRVRAAGLLLLPSLIDFHFCWAGIPCPGASASVKQGRADVIVDPGKRRRFLDQVLRPFLDVSAAQRDVIYAWELVNEPEWCTEEDSSIIDAMNPRRTVPQPEMLAFLREGAALINEAGFLSTVGFNRPRTIASWDSPGLGIRLHQCHYYAAEPPLPPHTFDPRWPCIVGEFPSAPYRQWPELGAAQDVFSRLRLIEQKGYPAAFLWSAQDTPPAPDNPVAWNDATRDDLRRYLSGGAPVA